MATEIKKNDTTKEKLIILLAKYIKECSKKLNENTSSINVPIGHDSLYTGCGNDRTFLYTNIYFGDKNYKFYDKEITDRDFLVIVQTALKESKCNGKVKTKEWEEVKDDRIIEPIKFLTYLNSRSYIPITYKRSNINAREEYFVRVDHLPVRLLVKDVIKDDGNKYGHISDDFGIEMQVEVRFPSMQLYIYFSREEFTNINIGSEVYNIDNTLMMSLHYYDDPPPINDKGWKLTINAQWEEEKPGDINIDLNELFNGELSQIANYLTNKFISPSVFIDVQIFSAGIKLDTDIDWGDMKLHAYNPSDKLVSSLAIYVDLEYLNSMRIESYGDNSSKVLMSDPNRSY